MGKDMKHVTLTWNNINVYLPNKDNSSFLSKLSFRKTVDTTAETSKHIVRDVDGIAKPNEVLAIMGASGAGKTTLLNVLNFRNRGTLKINGDVKVNGQTVTSNEVIAAISGYVQQDDLFIGTLKVKEHLVFQAMLKMDSHISVKDRYKRVEEVLNDLNLKKVEDSLIGIPEKGVKGISGGEKRRLAFASEIITDPLLLFCDEPTSGLDSYMAQSIVESMRNLARQGRTIICTIHQPSSEVFEMFDRLCLLAEGRLAYLGQLTKAQDFFTDVGYICPKNYNPADYYIHKLAVVPSEKERSKATIKEVCDAFEKSTYKQELMHDINTAMTEPGFLPKSVELFKASCVTQTLCLLKRTVISLSRDPFALRSQAMQSIMIAILFGMIYFQLSLDQKGIQNINGLLFLFITNTSFSNMFPVINVFTSEFPIFYREHNNGMYRVITYYLSKLIVDIPIYIILPTIFVSIGYWMSNLNNDIGIFFTAVFIIIIVANTAVAFGTFISVCSPSTNAALAIAGPVLVPLMIFSGFFLNNASIPVYLIWFRYISWFNYANEALIINQWSNIKSIPCPDVNTTRCFKNGDEVMAYLDMDRNNFTMNILLVISIAITWRVLSFLVLLLKSKKK